MQTAQSSPEPRRPLRIGLLLDSLEVRAWVYEMLETVLSDGHASIDLLILNTTANPAPPASERPMGPGKIADALANRVAAFINRFYIQRDRSVESATSQRSLRNLLPNTRILEVRTQKTRHIDTVPDDAVAQIREHDLDILFRVGFRILKGDILKAARHGIWSYHHGDAAINRGGPPCYWEVMESWPQVGSMLQVLDEELDGGVVLYRSTGPVFPYSLHNTRNRLYWKSSSYFPRVLKELHQYPDTFYQRVAARQPSAKFYSQRMFRAPSARQNLTLTLRKAVAKIRTTVGRRLNIEQWILLFHLRKESHDLGPTTSPWRYTEILPPRDRIWADPHLLARNGKFYIFLEEQPLSTMKGHISVMEMDADGNHSEPVPILETDYHLSYPFVMEEEGELWMIPESKSNNTVDLYRCSNFPLQWEHYSTLIADQPLFDPTLFFHEGKWWMFANMESHRTMLGHGWEELHLFYADDFRSNTWTPHPLNPIVTDVSCARPAGPLFMRDGKLLRPSQNCNYDYGYGFNLSEILTLTTDDYREQLIDRVTPDWKPDIVATHSVSHVSDGQQTLSVIDALKRRKRWN